MGRISTTGRVETTTGRRIETVGRVELPPGTNPILSLSGLMFYVDRLVAQPTLSGSDVTAWNDLSGQGNHLNQASASKPQWSAGNGVVFVKANSTGLWRNAANIIAAGAYTFGLVMRHDATTATDQAFFTNANATGSGGVAIAYSDAGVCWQVQHVNVANQQDNSTPKAPPIGTFVVATARRPAASNDDWRINDTAHTFSVPDNAPTTPGASAQLSLGGRGNAASLDQFSSCTVAAAFLCNADIGASNVTAVVSYWRAGYGF